MLESCFSLSLRNAFVRKLPTNFKNLPWPPFDNGGLGGFLKGSAKPPHSLFGSGSAGLGDYKNLSLQTLRIIAVMGYVLFGFRQNTKAFLPPASRDAGITEGQNKFVVFVSMPYILPSLCALRPLRETIVFWFVSQVLIITLTPEKFLPHCGAFLPDAQQGFLPAFASLFFVLYFLIEL